MSRQHRHDAAIDLSVWLNEHRFEEYLPVLQENGIRTLMDLKLSSDTELEAAGIILGHRKRMRRELHSVSFLSGEAQEISVAEIRPAHVIPPPRHTPMDLQTLNGSTSRSHSNSRLHSRSDRKQSSRQSPPVSPAVRPGDVQCDLLSRSPSDSDGRWPSPRNKVDWKNDELSKRGMWQNYSHRHKLNRLLFKGFSHAAKQAQQQEAPTENGYNQEEDDRNSLSSQVINPILKNDDRTAERTSRVKKVLKLQYSDKIDNSGIQDLYLRGRRYWGMLDSLQDIFFLFATPINSTVYRRLDRVYVQGSGSKKTEHVGSGTAASNFCSPNYSIKRMAMESMWRIQGVNSTTELKKISDLFKMLDGDNVAACSTVDNIGEMSKECRAEIRILRDYHGDEWTADTVTWEITFSMFYFYMLLSLAKANAHPLPVDPTWQKDEFKLVHFPSDSFFYSGQDDAKNVLDALYPGLIDTTELLENINAILSGEQVPCLSLDAGCCGEHSGDDDSSAIVASVFKSRSICCFETMQHSLTYNASRFRMMFAKKVLTQTSVSSRLRRLQHHAYAIQSQKGTNKSIGDGDYVHWNTVTTLGNKNKAGTSCCKAAPVNEGDMSESNDATENKYVNVLSFVNRLAPSLVPQHYLDFLQVVIYTFLLGFPPLLPVGLPLFFHNHAGFSVPLAILVGVPVGLTLLFGAAAGLVFGTLGDFGTDGGEVTISSVEKYYPIVLQLFLALFSVLTAAGQHDSEGERQANIPLYKQYVVIKDEPMEVYLDGDDVEDRVCCFGFFHNRMNVCCPTGYIDRQLYEIVNTDYNNNDDTCWNKCWMVTADADRNNRMKKLVLVRNQLKYDRQKTGNAFTDPLLCATRVYHVAYSLCWSTDANWLKSGFNEGSRPALNSKICSACPLVGCRNGSTAYGAPQYYMELINLIKEKKRFHEERRRFTTIPLDTYDDIVDGDDEEEHDEDGNDAVFIGKMSAIAVFNEITSRAATAGCRWCNGFELYVLFLALPLGIFNAVIPTIYRTYYTDDPTFGAGSDYIAQWSFVLSVLLLQSTIYFFFIHTAFMSRNSLLQEMAFTNLTDKKMALRWGLPFIDLSSHDQLLVWLSIRKALHVNQGSNNRRHGSKLAMQVLAGLGLALFLLVQWMNGEDISFEPSMVVAIFNLVFIVIILSPQLIRAVMINHLRSKHHGILLAERAKFSRSLFARSQQQQETNGGSGADRRSTRIESRPQSRSNSMTWPAQSSPMSRSRSESGLAADATSASSRLPCTRDIDRDDVGSLRRKLLVDQLSHMQKHDEKFRILGVVVTTTMVGSIIGTMLSGLLVAGWDYVKSKRSENLLTGSPLASCIDMTNLSEQCGFQIADVTKDLYDS